MRKRWVSASAATLMTFATIMPSADAATPWRTFGAAGASAHSGFGPAPAVKVTSETRRNPTMIRFIADMHHDGLGFVFWVLGCIDFDTGRIDSRTGVRGFSRRFVMVFDRLPTGQPDFCVLRVSSRSPELSKLTLRLQARYP
jgi:hypothetical protein